MSAAAPPPPRRALPTAKAACWRMPPRPAWYLKFPKQRSREREPRSLVRIVGWAKQNVLTLRFRSIAMTVVSADLEPLTLVFEDDGLVPNNTMPFLVYRGAVDVANAHPEKT